MAAWAAYCGKVDTADAGKLVPITARKA